MKWLRNRIDLLRNDKELSLIMFLHILLIGLHVYENYVGNIEYHWHLRAGGCGLIALCIFLFGRKGLSFALVVFSCALVYINNFYNYATIFFMLVAMGANPKIRKAAPWIYLANVFVAYSLKRLGITPFIIHIVYCVMFYTKVNYVFAVHKPEKLNLTDSERQIMDLKLQGKQQKEIDLYSQQTISAKMKSARERNLCETTEELMAKYAKEKENV
ncbi:MAG: hypothetical protein J6V90_08500 [Treponema sp.]|nr:hypothetical protein [Treponema sp.]